MGSWKRYRDTILVVLLLALPFFVLRTRIRKPENMSVVDRAIVRITTPIQYASAAIARGVSRLVGDYVYLVDVKSDNDKLAFENARLRDEVRQLENQRSENRRLKRLLGLRDEIPQETLSALVIGKDTTEYFRVAHVTLDAPSTEVQQNMPVVSVDGVVGTVLRGAGDSVDVRLTVDSGFGVDVVVERTGARGFVRGVGDRNRYAVSVEYVKRSDEVDVGDLLLTSGVGCRFPKGIPVARVTKVEKRDFGIYQTVQAEPTVDYSRLEEVLIVLSDTERCSPADGAKPKAP
ncbi:MAG: rod shape-determining protein MreC [Polyangiaceae bacterium]|nr:rod shape-determining protein MreC [Polyangiaceae bacterium]MCB9605137.1 rod shape-determining protein MreC [Polyangiaceae bacterium]